MKRKLQDKRKQIVAKVKGYLDGLPPETRRRIVLGMLAAFAVLALYTFGRAVYDIGRNDGSHMETGHAGRVELPTPAETGNHLTPYLYGTCLLYTSPSPRDRSLSRMPSSA